MIDHVSLRVSDFPRSRAFFGAALAPLGYGLFADYGDAAGFGVGAKPDFWIGAGEAPGATHVCFAAASRAQVDAFHKAALAAGGRDNGAPGLRTAYHPTYYGAFVLDPDGNNIEAVCHQPA
ncbi:MAG TPA: VOC family protein [Myxococcota bacterium]|nr:VOC family protein [Myxococcota bacterium]